MNAPVSVDSVDLVRENARVLDDLVMALIGVCGQGDFILGEAVEHLEVALASMCGAREAVAVGSGTDAIALALRSAGVQPGDEVITAPNSFVGTAGAIVQIGATPVFVDVDDDELIDVDAVGAAITDRTAAIVPVHLRGQPADVLTLKRLADPAGIVLIEDCAQAFLASVGGRCVGTFGAAGCFSLHPLKNPGAAGDGGFVLTNSPAMAATLRQLRNHGLAGRSDCQQWGVNSRLDTLQAAVVRLKLPYAGRDLAARRVIADRYDEALHGIEGLRLPRRLHERSSAWYSYVVQVAEGRRDALRESLAASGIRALVHYPVPIHLQQAAAPLGYRPGSLPVAERQAIEILTLPLFSTMDDSEHEHVAAKAAAFFGR